MEKKIPVYQMLMSEDIDELTGISIISFVKNPAIQANFITLSENEIKPTQVKLSVVSEAKRIVMGAILIPDLPIFRPPDEQDPDGHYMVYSAEVIEQAALKFFKTHRNNNVDVNHSGVLLAGVTCFESFQSDFSRGFYPPKEFSALPDRTLYQAYKLENDELYAACLDGTFQGFSITGLFKMKQVNLSEAKINQQILDELNVLLGDI